MNYRVGLFCAALTLLGGCDWFGGAPSSSKAPKAYIVNVLSKELYDDAHIEGSINAPFEKLTEIAQKWNKNVPVVLYCSNYLCTASKQGVGMLKEMGFESVRAYEGGTAEWYQLGKKDPSFVVKGPAQQKYLTMEIEPPAHDADAVPAITADELKKLIKEASIAE